MMTVSFETSLERAKVWVLLEPFGIAFPHALHQGLLSANFRTEPVNVAPQGICLVSKARVNFLFQPVYPGVQSNPLVMKQDGERFKGRYLAAQ